VDDIPPRCAGPGIDTLFWCDDTSDSSAARGLRLLRTGK
jgi:hypothetical protein